MHIVRNNKDALGRFALGLWLAACFSVGPLCVSANAQETPEAVPKQTPAEEEADKAREEAAKRAEQAHGMAMKLNSDVASAISVVKGVITKDPLAIIDALIDLLGIGASGSVPSLTIEEAKTEIITEVRTIRGQELKGRTEAVLNLMKFIVNDPDRMVSEGRTAEFLTQATLLHGEVAEIMMDTEPARAEFVYDLAPTFNTAVSTLAFALALEGAAEADIEDVYAQALDINDSLVSDGDQYGGSLYRVAQRNAGPFQCSAWVDTSGSPAGGGYEAFATYDMDLTKGWVVRSTAPLPGEITQQIIYRCEDPEAGVQLLKRVDADPMLHLIRRAFVDQQLALFF
jgi:hypothetical protein